MPPPTPDDIVGLDMMIRGQVIVPRSILFEAEAKKMHNAMLHSNNPAFYVRCKDVADVQHALKFVTMHDLQLSIRSGGHSVCGSSIREGSVVVDIGSIDHVDYDETTEQLTVGPGATLSDVNIHLLRHGRMTPVGIAPPTGCGGLITQGGVGWLLHRYGTSVDNVTGMTMVLADGTVKELDHDSKGDNRELFFAARGAAGVLGIVTSIRMRTHPMEDVTGGFWIMPDDDNYTKTRELAKLGRDLVLEQERDEARKLFGATYMGNIPPEEFIPEELRGRPCTIVVMACWGTDDEAKDIVNKFVDREIVVGKPPGPMPFNVFNQLLGGMFMTFPALGTYWKVPFTDQLADKDIDAFVDKWVDHEPWLNASLVGFEFQGGKEGRRYGSELNEGNDNCVANLRKFMFAAPAFLYYPPEQENFQKARTIARDMASIFEEYIVSSYSNTVMELEDKAGSKRESDLSFSSADRIQTVKKRVDPKNLFTRSVISVAQTQTETAPQQ